MKYCNIIGRSIEKNCSIIETQQSATFVVLFRHICKGAYLQRQKYVFSNLNIVAVVV